MSVSRCRAVSRVPSASPNTMFLPWRNAAVSFTTFLNTPHGVYSGTPQRSLPICGSVATSRMTCAPRRPQYLRRERRRGQQTAPAHRSQIRPVVPVPLHHWIRPRHAPTTWHTSRLAEPRRPRVASAARPACYFCKSRRSQPRCPPRSATHGKAGIAYLARMCVCKCMVVYGVQRAEVVRRRTWLSLKSRLVSVVFC